MKKKNWGGPALSPQISGSNVPSIDPECWSLPALPGTHYTTGNLKTHKKKERKKRGGLELLQSCHHLRTAVRMSHRRQASQEGSEGKEGPLPARSFCFELDPPCLLCQGPKPRLTTRLGDLSSRFEACTLVSGNAPCVWGLLWSWNCSAAYNVIVWVLEEPLRASSWTPFRKKSTWNHSVTCQGQGS